MISANAMAPPSKPSLESKLLRLTESLQLVTAMPPPTEPVRFLEKELFLTVPEQPKPRSARSMAPWLSLNSAPSTSNVETLEMAEPKVLCVFETRVEVSDRGPVA